jgi:hypothetical protein
MTLTEAADCVAELLRVHGLAHDVETPGEVVEFSWDRAAGVWLLLSQTNGEPVLEVIDQRGHGMTVTRQAVTDALLNPAPLVTALRRVVGRSA